MSMSTTQTSENTNTLLQAIFERSDASIIVLDDQARITNFNKSTTELFRQKDLRQKNLLHFFTQDYLKNWKELIKQDSSVGETFLEIGKEKIHLRFQLEPNFVPGHHLLILSNITDRRITEESLHRTQFHYKNLIHNIPDVVWTISKKGKVTFLSDNFEKLTGYSNGEISQGGLNFFLSRLDPEDHSSTKEKFSNLFELGKRPALEYRFKTKSGKWIWIWDRISETYQQGGVILADGVLSDITAEKELQEKVHQKNQDLLRVESSIEEEKIKVEAILEGMGEGVVVVDTKSRIKSLNKAAKVLLGFGEKELIEQDLYTKILIQDTQGNLLPRNKRPIIIALKTKHKVISTNGFIVRNDATRIAIEETVSPYFIKGIMQGVVVLLRDITRAKEADQLKSDFISIVAHQLRTPLGGMRWSLELMLNGDLGEIPPDLKTALRDNYDRNNRMIELVNELLDIAHIDQGTLVNYPKSINIEKVINDAANDMHWQAKIRKVTFSIKNNLKNSLIKIDPKRFREVVDNLISNAVKYNKIGGSVEIVVEETATSIIIHIQDSGIGIPKKDQEKIFSKFYRALNAQVSDTIGTGLGLFVVRSYVDSWGGRVWFESIEGKGSSFSFSIPTDK